jgi:hypothetical protein
MFIIMAFLGVAPPLTSLMVSVLCLRLNNAQLRGRGLVRMALLGVAAAVMAASPVYYGRVSTDAMCAARRVLTVHASTLAMLGQLIARPRVDASQGHHHEKCHRTMRAIARVSLPLTLAGYVVAIVCWSMQPKRAKLHTYAGVDWVDGAHRLHDAGAGLILIEGDFCSTGDTYDTRLDGSTAMVGVMSLPTVALLCALAYATVLVNDLYAHVNDHRCSFLFNEPLANVLTSFAVGMHAGLPDLVSRLLNPSASYAPLMAYLLEASTGLGAALFIVVFQLALPVYAERRDAKIQLSDRLRWKADGSIVQLSPLAEGLSYHLFLSHEWSGGNQEKMRLVKDRLRVLLLTVHVFLDVVSRRSISHHDACADAFSHLRSRSNAMAGRSQVWCRCRGLGFVHARSDLR